MFDKLNLLLYHEAMRNDILIGIVITLLNEGKCSYQKLADKFEVCKKTIQRYMTTLEMAGIPTVSTYGRGGGTEIVGAFNLENIFFTKPEIARLLSHLKSSPLIGLDNIDKQIEEKLEFKYNDVETIQNNFIIDHTSWGYSKTLPPILKFLSDKIGSNKTFNITYINSNGNLSKRTISPYKIIFKDFKWYLLGLCHTKKEVRIFKLNRIQELEPSEEEFIPLSLTDNEITNHINSSFNMIQLELEINSLVLPDIEEWIDITEIKALQDNQFKIVGTTSNNSNLLNKILSYTTNVKLLSPTSILNDLKNKCQTLSKLYL